jgi:hypothetical protein
MTDHHAAQVRAIDAAIRKLTAARQTLRTELHSPRGQLIDGLELAYACDDLAKAIHNLEHRRRGILDLIVQIAEEHVAGKVA